MYNLKTLAITTDRNGKEYTHKVALRPSRYSDPSLVLHIEGTPGHWYLKTLFGKDEFSGGPVGETIAIDFGQNWDCINMGAIMREVRAMLGVSINPLDFSPVTEPLATAVVRPNLGVNENLQLVAGLGKVTLHRVQNHAGDVYFRLRAESYTDGRRSCFTLIEYSSEELARTEFSRMTGGV